MEAVPDSSGSESEASEASKAEENFGQGLLRRLKASQKPFFAGICTELLFCALMSKWFRENEVHFSPLERWIPVGEPDLMKLCWTTFLVTGIIRLVCICGLPRARLRARTVRICTAIYILAGTFQWVIYLSAFYVEYDAATPVERVHDVKMAMEEVPTFLGSPLASCLRKNSWNYTACRVQVTKNCTLPYVPGHDYANGDCVETVVVSGERCCVYERVILGKPKMEFGFPVDDLFMLVKWLAILTLGWVVRGWMAMPAADALTSGTWLDILDAVVFSENVLSPAVRHPAYGIDLDGSMRPKDAQLFVLIFLTWLVAFSTVVVSPTLFVALIPAAEGPLTSEELQQEQLRRFQDSLACCDEHEAKDASDTAIELLRRRLKERGGAGGHPVCVDLHDDSVNGQRGCGGHLKKTPVPRAGVALPHDLQATYLVKFSDGRSPREEIVSLENIFPNRDYLEESSGSCCTGWLDCDDPPEASAADRFLRRAKVLDSVRSLLCLELPFLCWRLYIDWYTVDIASARILFILKNAIWAVIDFLTILSCGGDGGVMCFFAPLRHVNGLSDTQLGKIWIGPAGLFLLAAQVATSALKLRLQRRRDNLLEHRAWLQSQRDMGVERQMHEAKLKEVAAHLDAVDEKLSYAQLA